MFKVREHVHVGKDPQGAAIMSGRALPPVFARLVHGFAGQKPSLKEPEHFSKLGPLAFPKLDSLIPRNKTSPSRDCSTAFSARPLIHASLRSAPMPAISSKARP